MSSGVNDARGFGGRPRGAKSSRATVPRPGDVPEDLVLTEKADKPARGGDFQLATSGDLNLAVDIRLRFALVPSSVHLSPRGCR
jgi:hypothetical protein